MRWIAWVTLASLPLGNAAAGRDVFLTIGGGGSPGGNQVSLEKNVLYFQRTLQALGRGDARHDIYFSDGNDPGRDLQYFDPAVPIPEANRILAELCGQEDGIYDQYRTHQVPGIRGPATHGEIERWFDEARGQLGAADRLFIYFTGHGGKGDKQASNHMHLWSGEKLTVSDFAAQLDKLPPEVAVVVVMVQCYSGGFANLIFNEANAEKGPTPRNLCGFFATMHDRVAAGCTADIDEENYQEYSSYFWAALSGRKRLGEALARPDYDRDGGTSFEEAHAFALLESDTIDVSLRTSDVFLTRMSKTKADGRGDLLVPDASTRQLLAAAGPVDSAILSGLIEQLGVDDPPAASARELNEKLKKEKEEVEKQKGKVRSNFNKAAAEMFKSIKLRWPELSNAWHPRVVEILTSESGPLIDAVKREPRFSELGRMHEQIEQLDVRSLDLRRKMAKCQRLLNIAERIALEANLSKLADAATVARYQTILAGERSRLDNVLDPPPAAPATPSMP